MLADMEDWSILIIAAGFVIGVGVLWNYHFQTENRARRVLWRRIAKRRAGIFHQGTADRGDLGSDAIESDAGDARVLLDLCRLRTGDENQTTLCTRAQARFVLGAGPAFRVEANSL